MAQIPAPTSIPLEAPQFAPRPTPSWQPGVVPAAEKVAADANEQAGRTIAQAGAQIGEASDRLALAHASQTFLDAKLKADQDALNDPDYANAPAKYQASIKKAMQDASQGIFSPVMRQEFQSSTARLANFGADAVIRESHRKSVDAGRGNTLDAINSGVEQALQAGDEPTRMAALDAIHQRIDAATEQGWFTATEAARLRKTVPEQVAEGRAKMLIQLDPVAAYKLLAPQGAENAPGLAPRRSGSAITSLPAPVQNGIQTAASKYGVDGDTLARTALLESGGRTDAANPSSSASGPFQFTSGTAKQYALTDATSPEQSADAAARLLRDNTATLTAQLGRPPTPAEQYLAHQQGAAGASALLVNPSAPAIDVLAEQYGSIEKARAAILGNGGTADMTAGQFAQMWGRKFNQVGGDAQDGIETVAVQPGAAGRDQIFPKSGDWRDFFSNPEKRLELATAARRQMDIMQAAQDANATRQRAADEQARKAQLNAIADPFVKALATDPSKADLNSIVNADPNVLHYTEKWQLLQMYRASTTHELSGDAKTYGAGFYKVMSDMNRPDGDPARITDPKQLWPLAAQGDLTVSGVEKLSGMLTGKGPDKEAENRMIHGALDYGKHQLSFEEDYGVFKLRDPKGEDSFNTGFLPAFYNAYEAGRHAGKTPTQLLSKDSPDFIVDKVAAAYRRNPAQMASDRTAAGVTVMQAPDISTPEGLALAVASGRMTREQGMSEAMKRGYVRPQPDVPLAK